MGINHHFARYLRLPMKEFKFEGKIYINFEFEGKVCLLTPCLFVQSFNMHWWSSSWLYLIKEIASKSRRSYSPAHSQKSPPYLFLSKSDIPPMRWLVVPVVAISIVVVVSLFCIFSILPAFGACHKALLESQCVLGLKDIFYHFMSGVRIH